MRNRVRVLCCRIKPLTSLLTVRCSSSLNCTNEYLAIDSDEYLRTNILRAIIAAWLDVLRCSSIGQVCQEVTCRVH
ncbi:hypothetical protein NP493_241g02011 [Ridgeia piscesae]|uniref:Uncharacterized protein n=1 Tax=Ridgeia piscesae TaxID=27915 RepID=A0AAD9NZA1_RIDPI|nr:hypothetical protein NP493_241g02011 [Ridgeia piscesae]